MTGLSDSFDRPINYLRISVTDRCNLRCRYCMPLEGIETLPHDDILRYEEVHTVAKAAAEGSDGQYANAFFAQSHSIWPFA